MTSEELEPLETEQPRQPGATGRGGWWKLPQEWRADTELGPKLAELKKSWADKVIEAEIALEKEWRSNRLAAIRKEDEADAALFQNMHEQMAQTALASVDRARSGAEFLEKASAALAGLYTGVAALLLATDTPLPTRGLIPTIFLGLAVVAAAYYLAYLTPNSRLPGVGLTGVPAEDAPRRTSLLTRWARHIALQRASALRAGVVSLALGVAFLPVGFLNFAPFADIGAQIRVVGDARPSPAPNTAAASPTPSPTWPSPTLFEPVELAQVLYEAQLEDFQAQRGKPTKATTTGAKEEMIAWVLGVLGIVVVFAVWAERLWKPHDT